VIVSRSARSFAIPAAVVAGLCLFAGPRSALAKNQQSPSSRASASLKAAPRQAEEDVSATFQLNPRVDLRFFTWKEFGTNDRELLTESGPLFAFGVDPRVSFGRGKRFFVEAGTRLYLGKVDYDGAMMNGIPYKSKTGYFGLELLPTAGYVFSLGRHLQLSPTAGVGFEYWNRDIDDGGRNGYDEKYTVYRIHSGLRGTYLLNRDIRFYSTLQLKVPVSISESVRLGARGQGRPLDVSLSPGISPAIVVEGGSTIHGVDVALYYETWTLARSNEDKGFHQPESTRKIFGIRVGHSFGLN